MTPPRPRRLLPERLEEPAREGRVLAHEERRALREVGERLVRKRTGGGPRRVFGFSGGVDKHIA